MFYITTSVDSRCRSRDLNIGYPEYEILPTGPCGFIIMVMTMVITIKSTTTKSKILSLSFFLFFLLSELRAGNDKVLPVQSGEAISQLPMASLLSACGMDMNDVGGYGRGLLLLPTVAFVSRG